MKRQHHFPRRNVRPSTLKAMTEQFAESARLSFISPLATSPSGFVGKRPSCQRSSDMNVQAKGSSTNPSKGRTTNPFRKRYGHFIGGEWIDGVSGETIAQFNPATGEQLSVIAAGTAEDVERAVAAASAAFP